MTIEFVLLTLNEYDCKQDGYTHDFPLPFQLWLYYLVKLLNARD